MPAASSSWRCESPSFAHSSFEMRTSSGVETARRKPESWTSVRLLNSSSLNGRLLHYEVNTPTRAIVNDVKHSSVDERLKSLFFYRMVTLWGKLTNKRDELLAS